MSTRSKRAEKGIFDKASSVEKLAYVGRQLAAADTMVCESRDREDALKNEIARLKRLLDRQEKLLKSTNSKLQVQGERLEKALESNSKLRTDLRKKGRVFYRIHKRKRRKSGG